jgi:glycosyltransferase involved in cell wall biosynthesis
MRAEKPNISIVIPAYNEEGNIERCFISVTRVIERYGMDYEIILEEDGSTDKTPEIIDALANRYPNVTALHESKRRGKGFGIKKGMGEAKGEILAIIDGDMEYPPENLPDMFRLIDFYDIVIGIKSEKSKKRLHRAILSKLHNLTLRMLFEMDLQGSQSGLKVFRRVAFEAVKPLMSNGFEIDTEILVKAIRKGYRVYCIPVVYRYKGSTRVNIFKDPIKMLISILRLRARIYSEKKS